MADNYLEKRMADYRAGKLASPSRLAPAQPVLPAIHLHGTAPEALVRALRAIGAPVSFSGPDARSGTALAQSSGSTFCPMEALQALDTMTRRRGTRPMLVWIADTHDVRVIPPEADAAVATEAPAGCHLLDPAMPASTLARLLCALASLPADARPSIEVKKR